MRFMSEGEGTREKARDDVRKEWEMMRLMPEGGRPRKKARDDVREE